MYRYHPDRLGTIGYWDRSRYWSMHTPTTRLNKDSPLFWQGTTGTYMCTTRSLCHSFFHPTGVNMLDLQWWKCSGMYYFTLEFSDMMCWPYCRINEGSFTLVYNWLLSISYFNPYYSRSSNQPVTTRVVDQRRIGLPTESSISEETLHSCAIQPHMSWVFCFLQHLLLKEFRKGCSPVTFFLWLRALLKCFLSHKALLCSCQYNVASLDSTAQPLICCHYC